MSAPCVECGTTGGGTRARRRRGQCDRCYERARRRAAGITAARPRQPPCSICGERSRAKGLCKRHYDATRHRGKPPRPPRVCEVPDCGGKHSAKGLCMVHYYRQRRGTFAWPPVAPPRPRLRSGSYGSGW